MEIIREVNDFWGLRAMVWSGVVDTLDNIERAALDENGELRDEEDEEDELDELVDIIISLDPDNIP